MLGVMNFIMPVGVAVSTFGCALNSQFSIARLCYVAGREGYMVEAFSYIHVRHLTPVPAVVLQVCNPMNFNCYRASKCLCNCVIAQTDTGFSLRRPSFMSRIMHLGFAFGEFIL
jgi:hypothetical protein